MLASIRGKFVDQLFEFRHHAYIESDIQARHSTAAAQQQHSRSASVHAVLGDRFAHSQNALCSLSLVVPCFPSPRVVPVAPSPLLSHTLLSSVAPVCAFALEWLGISACV